MPLTSRTRATLRSAEFGFFGVVVYTRVHTPRFWGAPFSAGVADFLTTFVRALRTSWLMVGTCVLLALEPTFNLSRPIACHGRRAVTRSDSSKAAQVLSNHA